MSTQDEKEKSESALKKELLELQITLASHQVNNLPASDKRENGEIWRKYIDLALKAAALVVAIIVALERIGIVEFIKSTGANIP